MKFLADGVRAALVVGALLTMWSFLRVGAAMQSASDAAGFVFVAVAFGMLTMFAIGWGIVIGAITSIVVARVRGRRRWRNVAIGTAGASSVALTIVAVWLTTIPGIEPTAVWMSLATILGAPALIIAQRWLNSRSVLWNYGVPIAGTAAALLCFVGASKWSSSSLLVREAVTRTSALVALQSRILRSVSDGDGDGFSGIYGGPDCDDASPDVYPGALEIPDNGIDEDCSGRDASSP